MPTITELEKEHISTLNIDPNSGQNTDLSRFRPNLLEQDSRAARAICNQT